ncbi:MAG: 3'-5' exonuclease [Gemella sp.]|nr:3'-5' exonuclease [Gemella sp.]
MTNYSIVDIELTEDKEIIEIAIIKTDKQFNIISKHDFLLKSSSPISKFMENLTGISQEMLEDKPFFSQVAREIFEILGEDILICHGVNQDYEMIKEAFLSCGIDYAPKALIDTVELSKIFLPTLKSYRLGDISASIGMALEGQFHRADVDTEATYNLVQRILKELNLLTDRNYKYLMKLMFEYSYQHYDFLKKFRKGKATTKKGTFTAYELDFSTVIQETVTVSGEKYIYLSSIDETMYIDLHLSNQEHISILKDRYSYLVLNIFKIAEEYDEKYSKLKAILLMRMLVWIQYTRSGSFDEVNLDPSEKALLRTWYESSNSNLDSYYYNRSLEYASKAGSIVTNYKSVMNLLNEKVLNNHRIVAENKDILAQEIKKQCIKTYHYKEVLTELNITLTNNFTDKLALVKENLESVVNYLHELYINESRGLYYDAIEFLLQDIDYIKELVEGLKIRVFKTEKFINLLLQILSDENKGYYSFDHLNMAGSLYIKFYDNKNQKIIINKLHTRKIEYLKKPTRLTIKQVKSSELDLSSYEKNVLYLFESKKYRDLKYLSRNKKLAVKYKQYGDESSFADLYKDLLKTSDFISVCYAATEIKAYSIYLNRIFDEIISFKKFEL